MLENFKANLAVVFLFFVQYDIFKTNNCLFASFVLIGHAFKN